MVKLDVVSKGNRYVVLDQKERTIYNIKSGMGGKTHLINTGGYKLYHFTGDRKAKKPVFMVFHNDKQEFTAECTSLFLDPGFVLTWTDKTIEVISNDRQKFDIILKEKLKENTIGQVTVAEADNAESANDKKAETRYSLDINEKYYDDYIPLIAVFIDIAFGELNKG